MHSHLSFMSQYSNRLMMMWDTPVSFTINRYCARFIHSFHLISAAARARQASISLSLFFFFSFLYILFDSLCANAKEEWGKNSSFFFFILYDKKKTYWLSKWNYFSDHPFIEQHHSFNKKRKKTGLNHKSSYTFSFSVVPNVNVFYIHLKLHANVSIIDRKKKKKKDAGKGISLTRWRREMHAHTYTGKCLPLCLSTSETIVR